jgi:hypothetical protein
MRNMDRLKKGPYNPIMLVIMVSIAIAGLVTYRNTIIIEPGILCALGGLIYELRGTKNKIFEYPRASLYLIKNRVPIEVILVYLFGGMAFATYVFFRLGV